MSDTFDELRYHIVKTLDKVVDDIDRLKTEVTGREEYLRRFETMEKDVKSLRDKLTELDKLVAGNKIVLGVLTAAAGSAGALLATIALKALGGD